MENSKVEVIVVGAGPAGVSAAITIARAGKKVLLIERGEIVSFVKKLAGAMFKKRTFKNLGKYFNSTNQIFFKFLSSQFL